MLSQLIPFLFLCLSTGTFAVVDSDACLGGTNWKVAANNECSIESFKEALKPRFDKRCKRFGLSLDEDLQLLLGASSEKEARGKIEDICADAIGERHPKKIEFSSISNKAKGFDAAFFDGGTSWNEGELQQLNKGSFRGSGARRIEMYDRQSKRRVVKWPDDTPTLGSCQANAAMCCWPESGDVPAEMYGEDCDPIDGESDCTVSRSIMHNSTHPQVGNADICLVDLNKSRSSRFDDGITIFPNNTRVHCSGIAWENDANYWNSYLKGNLLFQSSMMLMKNGGHAKNLPAAPMCGCIEQMPIVTRADCTEAYTTARFVFQYRSTIPELKAFASKHLIQYRECKGLNATNDLRSFYDKLWWEKKVDSLQKKVFDGIVVGEGGCYNVTKAHLSEFVKNYFGPRQLDGNKNATDDSSY